jgi:hypothetical protein
LLAGPLAGIGGLLAWRGDLAPRGLPSARTGPATEAPTVATLARPAGVVSSRQETGDAQGRLAVEVRGIEQGLPGQVRVLLYATSDVSRRHAHLREPRIGEAVLERDGQVHFDADLDRLLWQGPVWTEVEHPRYLPARASVDRSDAQSSGVTLRVTLARACVLTGVVRDGSGAPVGDACVSFRSLGATTSPDGRFRLRAPRGERGLLRVCAGGFLAASFAQTTSTEDELAVPDVRLDRGATLRGKVTGHSDAFAEGRLEVRASWYGGDPPTGTDDGTPPRGRTAGTEVRARVAEDGTYLLGGLEPGIWRVVLDRPSYVGDPPPDDDYVVHPDLLNASDRVVTAPSDGVDFDVGRALLRVSVRREDGPVPYASIRLEDAYQVDLVTDGEGRAALLLPERSVIGLRGPTGVERSIRVGAHGTETRVEVAESRVDRPESPGELCSLFVTGPDGRPVTAWCRVYEADGRRRAVRFEARGPGVTFASAERLPPGGRSAVRLPSGVPLHPEFVADGYVTRREWVRIDPEEPRAAVLRVVLEPR